MKSPQKSDSDRQAGYHAMMVWLRALCVCVVMGMGMFLHAQAGLQPPVPAADSKNVIVLSDSELMPLTLPIARAYAALHHLGLTSAATGPDLIEQISQGLEAHVLITANKTLVDTLQERGLSDANSTRHFANARLALVTTRASKTNTLLSTHSNLASILYATPHIPIHLPPHQSAAGVRYAELLRGQGFSNIGEERGVASDSLNAQLEALRESNGLAFMITSDVAHARDLVVLATLPDALSSPVQYYAVVLASELMEPSRGYVRFLRSNRVRILLNQHGLEAVE